MRIVLVNKYHYVKGGTETYTFSLARALKAMGHEVHFFAMEDSQNVPCDDATFFVSSRDYNSDGGVLHKLRDGIDLIWSRESRDKFEALLQSVRPDIVHINLVHRQISLSILDAPSLRNIPVVYTSHEYIVLCPAYTMLDGSGEICERCLSNGFVQCLLRKCVKNSYSKSLLAAFEAEYIKFRRYYTRFDLIIAPSSFMGKKLVEGGFSLSKINVMQNFLPNDYLEKVKQDGNTTKDRYFLFFGRLSPEKGINVLLEAFSRFCSECGSERELVLVGDGPEIEYIRERLGSSFFSQRVRLLGRKEGDELRSIVERAYFSLIPSIWYENMPYSVLESLACGTPVIGSNIGGIPEVVIDGVTGYQCVPGDVESLLEAMKFAASLSEHEYLTMCQQGKDYITDRCSEKKYVHQLVDSYQRLIFER